MNTLERLIAAVSFQQPDRQPVIPQIFGHTANLAAVPLLDYLRNGEVLARCQLEALARYGHDALFAVTDVNVETEALGATLLYRRNHYPDVATYPLADPAALHTLSLPDPHHSARMPEVLKALSLLRRKVDETVLVVGCALGPMTLACQLLGMEPTLYAAADTPNLFEDLLDFATAVQMRYGQAQIAAGAHLVLLFEPAATPEVVPPTFFRELLLPRLQALCSHMKGCGGLANWLHIAGKTTPILPYYRELGVDVADFDYCVDPLAAQEALPQTCLAGNIKSYSFVGASPAQIDAQCRRLIGLFEERGGFILSSGCEIPPEARPEAIDAMVRAAGCREAG